MANAKFYVLGVYGDPWVLDSYDSIAKANGAIRWQNSAPGSWLIAKRTGPDTFLSDGRAITVQRGPYTAEAFESFKAEWNN